MIIYVYVYFVAVQPKMLGQNHFNELIHVYAPVNKRTDVGFIVLCLLYDSNESIDLCVLLFAVILFENINEVREIIKYS